MTITEKILARAAGKPRLSPGDVVFAKVDKVMMHDVSGPGVIKVFSEWEKKGKKLERIWNERIRMPWDDRTLVVVSRDGLITLKLTAGRPQDLVDIQSLTAAEGNRGKP